MTIAEPPTHAFAFPSGNAETSFETFLRQQFPAGETSVVALADDREHGAPLRWLSREMAMLQQERQLGTLGVELPAFMNVFFWAYQDKKIEKLLGSAEAAREYLRTIVAHAMPNFQAYDHELAELVVSALDHNVRVVAYDAPLTLRQLETKVGHAAYREHLDLHYQKQGQSHGMAAHDFRHYLRTHLNGSLSEVMKGATDERLGFLPKQAQRSDSYRAIVEATLRQSWVIEEAHHWLEMEQPVQQEEVPLSPKALKRLTQEFKKAVKRGETPPPIQTVERRTVMGKSLYQERLSAMERISAEGTNIHIGHDALSAALLVAAAVPERNCMLLSHLGRMDGLGLYHFFEKTKSYGTLPEHVGEILQGQHQPATVRRAVIADAALTENLYAWYNRSSKNYGSRKRLELREIPLFDIDKGKPDYLPALPQPVTDLAGKMPQGFWTNCWSSKEERAAWINPLKHPPIEAAMRDVAAFMQPHYHQAVQLTQEGLTADELEKVVAPPGPPPQAPLADAWWQDKVTDALRLSQKPETQRPANFRPFAPDAVPHAPPRAPLADPNWRARARVATKQVESGNATLLNNGSGKGGRLS